MCLLLFLLHVAFMWGKLQNHGGTMELVEDTHRLISFRACRGHSGPCRKHARSKEYYIDLAENTSWQNPHILTHVSRSCDFICDWSKLNA